MVRHISLALALASGLAVQAAVLWTEETDTIDARIGERQVKLMLTGSAVRTKSIFKIYTVDSYVEQSIKVRDARDMIETDEPKQLHLVMLRNITGPDMASAFEYQLRSNYPEPAFMEEVKTVANLLRGQTARKGEEIWFTHVPKVGFQCKSSGGMVHLVRNVEFSKAVWANYFGKNNVGENVKQALLSRLPRG